MRNQEIRNTVAELQNLYAKADELKAEITAREALIKDEMESRELEVLDLEQGKVRCPYMINKKCVLGGKKC